MNAQNLKNFVSKKLFSQNFENYRKKYDEIRELFCYCFKFDEKNVDVLPTRALFK